MDYSLCAFQLSFEEFHKLRHGAPNTGSKCRKTVDLLVLDGRMSTSSGFCAALSQLLLQDSF